MADSADDGLLSAAGPVHVLDAMPEAAPLLQAGVERLSTAILEASSGQIKATTSDLSFFQRANEAGTVEYGNLLSAVGTLGDFFSEMSREHALLEPHLTTVVELENAVTELEAFASNLVQHVKLLEASCHDVMQN